jgi:hypothetical protein
MLALVLLVVPLLVIDVITYARSADARLRRWRWRKGVQSYQAFALAEAAGRRMRTPDAMAWGTGLRWKVGLGTLLPLAIILSTLVGALLLQARSWLPIVIVSLVLCLQLNLPGTALKTRSGHQRPREAATLLSLVLLAVTAVVLGASLLWLAMTSQRSGALWVVWTVETAASYGAFLLATSVSIRARRWSAFGDVLEPDAGISDADTLFLRSFNDDSMRIWAMDPNCGIMGFLTGSRVRFEELVGASALDRGRTIAIGRPGEKLPELGSVRTYAHDSEWQRVVAEAARRVGCIHLVAGSTEGLEWEVSHVKELGLLRKTLILLPPLGEAASWRRLHTILRQLDLGFEEATAEDGPWLGVVLRMLTAIGVSATDHPVFYVSERRDWIAYVLTTSLGDAHIRGKIEPPQHGSIMRHVDPDFEMAPQ